MGKRIISITGLGYVGLPVAVALAKAGYIVHGYDHSEKRIAELKNGFDDTLEVKAAELKNEKLVLTNNPEDLARASIHIVAVPTPIDSKNEPDLLPLIGASQTLSKYIKAKDVIIFESTVFPGCTEEICLPILEKGSGLKSPEQFTVGYSPERINPGDSDHNLETIVKVISAQTHEALLVLEEIYGRIVKAGVHKAPSIKVAEAAKVIENIQRDVNIALINEFSSVFTKLQIDTYEVLEAAKTKWNFLPFKPGLVGGHCIGVDPYYLTHKAKEAGVNTKLILAGRYINNNVPSRIADHCQLWAQQAEVSKPNVLVLGATFKENVPDIRNSQIPKLIKELKRFCGEIELVDPYSDLFGNKLMFDRSGIECLSHIEQIKNRADTIILAVPHDEFISAGWRMFKDLDVNPRTLVFDVKAALPREGTPDQFTVLRL